ncbi:hypothetical protein GCM10023350_00150 [Nocardioides endophyticus]|uniref:IclR-ED domain-containing protein n=1 Tax=Nocardioides endophyticus TaxID=1353775 RepID=A0ABP8Y6A6_9ACTN
MAQPFMEDLYTALNQHVQLAVLEGKEAVILDRLSALHAVGLTSQVGGQLPLHCSGVGKVLLSHASSQLVEDVIGGRLNEHTDATKQTRKCCGANSRNAGERVMRWCEASSPMEPTRSPPVCSTGRETS